MNISWLRNVSNTNWSLKNILSFKLSFKLHSGHTWSNYYFTYAPGLCKKWNLKRIETKPSVFNPHSSLFFCFGSLQTWLSVSITLCEPFWNFSTLRKNLAFSNSNALWRCSFCIKYNFSVIVLNAWLSSLFYCQLVSFNALNRVSVAHQHFPNFLYEESKC